MKIICVSDTHEQQDRLIVPEGDILVHAGDLTFNGGLGAFSFALDWLISLPHKQKVVIAGNHDWCFENLLRGRVVGDLEKAGIAYLQDSSIEIGGLKFYGSPWQPRFFDWAFNVDRGPLLAEKWAAIPTDTQILVTHGPPYGILDETPDRRFVGCEDLRARINHLPMLRAHIFGHIHHSYGRREIAGIQFVNASSCDERYRPTNAPIEIEL